MENPSDTNRPGALSPLRETVFRRIWTASLLGNFGQLILGVGAAWEMTRLTASPTMVAMVQTAMMLPLMLATVPAGALADMFDRRKVAMAGLAFSIVSAAALTVLAFAGLASPWVLLGFCSLIGVGVAIYSPAWQASINEQVSPANLPAAVALGTISYNLARSFGPALGGVIVLTLGAKAAFATNAVFYVPMLCAFWMWNRKLVPSVLPPEGVGRAIVSGSRYVFHSPALKRILVRAFLFGFVGTTASALAPLIAKDLLLGDAAVYGILLGVSGVGAVIGALFVARLREHWGTDLASGMLLVLLALALILIGFSRNLILTCAAMMIAGGANMLVIALYNVVVQLAAPRWVLARALSLFGAALTGGIAIGAVFWGAVASHTSIGTAVIASGCVMLVLPLISLLLPIGAETNTMAEPVTLDNEPEIGLAITMQSGPVIIEIDYRVSAEDAREFYNRALKLKPLRMRNGSYAWSIERDIADPTLWTERYRCLTWADYLRVRDRHTSADVLAQNSLSALLIEGRAVTVRRRLDRPSSPAGWRAARRDLKQVDPDFIVP